MNSESVSMMLVSEKPICIVKPIKTINHLPLQPEGRVNENTNGTISFEGLPQGSTAAQVVRCIQLLEHIPGCGGGPGGCTEGEECRRTRQVLAHHYGCRDGRRAGGGDCSVCRQLMALCRNHSERCQANAGSCAVPYCKNKRVKAVPDPNIVPPNTSTEEQSRQEQQYVIRKLTEIMDLPTNQQKLREIKRLMETNRHATAKVLRSVLGKKTKPQPVSASLEMKNLVIGKGIKLAKGKSPQRVLNPKMWSSAATSSVKLDIVVRAPFDSPAPRRSASIEAKCG